MSRSTNPIMTSSLPHPEGHKLQREASDISTVLDGPGQLRDCTVSSTTGLRRYDVTKQNGITLVGALFIIVVMALLGTGLLQLTTTSQQSIGQEITSVKAYFAAHSALQWGMYQATYAGGSANGAHTLTFSNAGLSNTTGATDISSRTLEGRNFYLINASGQHGISSDPEFALRNLQLRFEF